MHLESRSAPQNRKVKSDRFLADMINGIEIHEHIRRCQNEVFKATVQGESCILRLTDRDHRSREFLDEELRLLRDLEAVTSIAVKPLTFPSGRFIEEAEYRGRFYNVVIFTFIEGSSFDISSYANACDFGALLAELHIALSELSCLYDLNVMENRLETKQLIHGDFNPTNVLFSNCSFIIIDFENSCYASFEYELANTIYMVLFDARNDPGGLLESGFIKGFLAGYTRDRRIDFETVRSEVDRRVSKLEGWLNDLASAPLSISASPESWKNELEDFIHAYQKGKYENVLGGIL